MPDGYAHFSWKLVPAHSCGHHRIALVLLVLSFEVSVACGLVIHFWGLFCDCLCWWLSMFGANFLGGGVSSFFQVLRV